MRAPIRKSGPAKICYDCDYELYSNGKIIFDDVSGNRGDLTVTFSLNITSWLAALWH